MPYETKIYYWNKGFWGGQNIPYEVYVKIEKDDLEDRIKEIIVPLNKGNFIETRKIIDKSKSDLHEEPRLYHSLSYANNLDLLVEDETNLKKVQERIPGIITDEIRKKWMEKSKEIKAYIEYIPYAYFDISPNLAKILTKIYERESEIEIGRSIENLDDCHKQKINSLIQDYYENERKAKNLKDALDKYHNLVSKISNWLSRFIGTEDLNIKYFNGTEKHNITKYNEESYRAVKR